MKCGPLCIPMTPTHELLDASESEYKKLPSDIPQLAGIICWKVLYVVSLLHLRTRFTLAYGRYLHTAYYNMLPKWPSGFRCMLFRQSYIAAALD